METPLKFWTVTNANTHSTNSRSERFYLEADAEKEAERRLQKPDIDAVFIMECIAVVRRQASPVVRESVTKRKAFAAPEPSESERDI